MNIPKELASFDFSDTVQIPNRCDFKTIPDLTRDNFQTLIEEHNNLVEAFNAMAEFTGFRDFFNYESEE